MPNLPLAQAIKKRQPFESLEEEAFLNLWRTFTHLAEPVERLFRQHGLCGTHYNILRILAGEKAGSGKGLPVLEVRQRLITRVPDITRLIDKLVNLGLVERQRSEADRRVITLIITATGEKLARDLRQPVTNLHREQLSHLNKNELVQLSRLLERARARLADEPET